MRTAGLGVAALAAGTGQAQSKKKPNVLVISVDDLNDWVGVLGGHPQSKTPNIDRLAKRGVAFRRAYCQAPACNPSRASVMSGIRPSTSGCYQNADVWRDAMPQAVTLPKHFMLHGYQVLGGGKTFHSTQNDAASWEYYFNPPGFIGPPERPVNGLNKGHFDWSPIEAEDADTADTMVAQWAADYVSQEHSKPFFLHCGLFRPHLPWYAPKKYFEEFPEADTLLPKYLEDDLADTPPSARRSLSDHDAITSTNQWKKAVAAYLACIRYADENVGRVLDALDSGPNAEDTIIVLWTDHGWHLGEKDHWRKFTLWERSCRVTMIMAVPGSAQDKLCDRTVELLDVYPTLSDLAGLPNRDELEGKSLRPLLEDPETPWDKPAITSSGADKTSVRTERWRYTEYPDGEELYDHDADPNEWTNLASKPEHAATRRRLSALLPKNRSTKKVMQFKELPEERKRLTELAPGRLRKSDPDNYVGLNPGPDR